MTDTCQNCKHEFTEDTRPSPTGTCPYCGAMQITEPKKPETKVVPESKPGTNEYDRFTKIGAGFL